MKKIIVSLCGLWAFVFAVHSQMVSLEQAQQVAENFIQSQSGSKSAESLQMRSIGVKQPTMFAFSSDKRWVLVAGDKRVQPLLAYSDENGGVFPNEDVMPPAMLYLIEWYGEQIDALRNDNIIQAPHPQWNLYLEGNAQRSSNHRTIVGPLLSRNGHEIAWAQKWNNGGFDITKSYNKFCPAVHGDNQNCTHAVVGCVAVATAQIMWYWQWPHAAVVRNDSGALLVRNYDWDLMPYELTNASSLEEADMVANLLHDVGVAENMVYGCTASGALPTAITTALNNIYGYQACNPTNRNELPDNLWHEFLSRELDEYQPIAYAGARLDNNNQLVGHQFVLDGYDTNGKYHINFGWGGSHNGYYSLDSIYGDYNLNQNAVFCIYPRYPSCNSITIPSTDMWPTKFVIQSGGALTIGDRTITEGMQGCLLAGDSVVLANGFTIEIGADVYIGIKNMHCGD